MNTKDKLVDLIRSEGYDFITACELASECIKEFQESGLPSHRYHIGRVWFTLRRGAT